MSRTAWPLHKPRVGSIGVGGGYSAMVAPPIGSTINPDHPLSRGLILASLYNEQAGTPLNLVYGDRAALSNSAVLTPMGLATPHDNLLHCQWSNRTQAKASFTRWSAFVVGFKRSANQGQVFAVWGGGTSLAWLVEFLSGGACECAINNGGATTGVATSTGTFPAVGPFSIGGSWDGATIRNYRNGQADGTASFSTTMGAGGSGSINTGNGDVSGTFGFDGYTRCTYLWDRVIPAAAFEELHVNPYCIIEPPGPRHHDAGSGVLWHTSAIKVRTV